MRIRSLVLCLTLLAAFAVGPAALAAPAPRATHASAADRAYSKVLQGIFSQMVTAGKDVVAGLTNIPKNYSAATSMLNKGLAIYKSAKVKTDGTSAPSNMASIKSHLSIALTDYIKAVTIYRDATSQKNINGLSKGVSIYQQGNVETNKAVAALKKIK
jgi:hypothetical protein